MSYPSTAEPANILFVHYGDNWIRGSEVCLINLVDSIDRQAFTPIIWTNNASLHKRILESEQSILSPFRFLFNELTPDTTFNGWIKQIADAVRIIKEYKIDLIHVNSGAPCQWMVVASYLTHVPMVTQLHSSYSWKDKITLGLYHAPLVITVSHAIRRSLRQEGAKFRNLKVISNGCTPPQSSGLPPMDVKKLLGLSKDHLLLVSVGSLIHRKGMDKLIKVIHCLNGSKNRYHLLIIGDGEERAALEKLCQQLQLESQIHFIGEQPDVYRWLQNGPDIFISGARNEAFGLALAEAALAPLPVIAPYRGGIPEVLQNRRSALLYRDDCENSIANVVKELASNPQLQQRLATTAKRHVEQTFSVTNNTRSFEKLYRNVINHPSKGVPSLSSLFYPFSYTFLVSALRLLKQRALATFSLKEIS